MDFNKVVYVGNVPKETKNIELVNFFKYGGVVRVSFMRAKREDCRNKIAFVRFENKMLALKACSLDQTIFKKNRVIVMLANDDRQFRADHSVIVRNISSEINEEGLFRAFSRYGQIENVQIPTDTFAYIGFREESAAEAARQLNNTMLGKTEITVQVSQQNMLVRLEDLDSSNARLVRKVLMGKLKSDKKSKKGQPEQEHSLDDDDNEDSNIPLDILEKKEQQRAMQRVLETVPDPNYRNPDPTNLSHEVVFYNCRMGTSLENLRKHFKKTAYVTSIRMQQHPYDVKSCKVYASFGSYVDAFKAVCMKGRFAGRLIFRHLASEKPKLDNQKALLIECQQDNISLNNMYNRLHGLSAIAFVNKLDHKKFLVICRQAKPKKVMELNDWFNAPMKVSLYWDVFGKQNAQDLPSSSTQKNPSSKQQQNQAQHRGETSRPDLLIPKDNLIATQQRTTNYEYEDRHPPSRGERHHGPGRNNPYKWVRDSNRGSGDSPILKKNSVDMDIAADQPEPVTVYHRQSPDFRRYFDEPRFDPGYQELDHQLADFNSDRPVPPEEMNRIDNFIREEERQITDFGGPSRPRERRSRSTSRSRSGTRQSQSPDLYRRNWPPSSSYERGRHYNRPPLTNTRRPERVQRDRDNVGTYSGSRVDPMWRN